MENLVIVATQVAILFALIAVGAVCRRVKLVSETTVPGLVNVLIIIVTPALIIDSFSRPFDPSMLAGLGVAFLFALGAHFVTIAVTRVAFRSTREDTRCVLKVATVFSNAGFMGVPLEQAVLGDKGVFYGIVYVVVFNLLMWSWGLSVMRRGESGGRFNRMMFVNPGTVGIAIGLVCFALPWELPRILREPVRMTAALNTPLAMIVIGYYLAGANLHAALRSGVAWLSLGIRLVAVPLAVTGALWCFRERLDPTLMLAVVIPAAAPVGAMVTMFSSRYARDVDMSVAMVSFSTLLSILTMPPVIALAMSVLQKGGL